ncbi:MAG: hypothetical protein R3F46_10065 [bacterium]
MDSKERDSKGRSGLSPLVTGILVVAVLGAGALGYVAYQRIAGSRPVPIGEILADLRSYDGTVVHVEGEVTSTMNLVVKWFEISDGTGSITVVTERGLPTVGTTVAVDGQVNELFNLGGISKTVLMEMPERQ